MSETLHADRTRMDRDVRLLEENPYSGETAGVPNTEMVWRSLGEIQEWAYEQGYDTPESNFFEIAPSEIISKIGKLFVLEGQDHARQFYHDEVQQTMDVIESERLSDYVDGQMRMFAGYDVAENGDTLEEGDYSTWEDLRMIWKCGVRDRLMGDDKYASV